MKPIFSPYDFNNAPFDQLKPEVCAAVANLKLEKLIESWPVVYGMHDDRKNYSKWRDNSHTHQARLAFIEELPKEPCKHQIIEYSVKGCQPVTTGKCGICGVALVAEWKERI